VSTQFGLIVFAAAGAGVLLLLTAARARTLMPLIGFMVFFGALGSQRDDLGEPVRTWLLPLQLRRSEAFALVGSIIGVCYLLHWLRERSARIAPPAAVMIAIGGYQAMMRFPHGAIADGMLTLVFLLLTQAPLLVAASKAAVDEESATRMIRWITFGTLAWLLASFVQYAINPSTVVFYAKSGFARFSGLSITAQAAGIILGPGLALALWLALNDPSRLLRLFWTVVVGLFGLSLIWTGSRTGLALASIGAGAVLYSRVARAALLLPIAAVFGLIMLQLIGGTAELAGTVDRIGSAGNTRAGSWARQLTLLSENPFFGAGADPEDRAHASENSYFYGIVAFGWGMGLLLLLLLATTFFECLRLVRYRRLASPPQRRRMDLVIGFYALFFLGAIFEGYIMARVNSLMVLFYVLSAVGAAAIRSTIDESTDEWRFEDEAEQEDYEEFEAAPTAG